MKLLGKVAIVTGGSGNLGQSIVEEFINEDANVVFTYYGKKENSDILIHKLRNFNNRLLSLRCDIQNSNDIENVINETLSKFKKIDILVNNAGIADNLPIELISEAILDKVIGIDLKGSFNFCKKVVPTMKKQKYGKIINISSIGGISGTSNQSAFGAAKSGLIGFTRNLAVELAQYNINVNSIAPGVIETDKKNKKEYEKIADIIPLKRVGKPLDIARTAVFLASDDSSFITGQTLVVDGGHSVVVFYNLPK